MDLIAIKRTLRRVFAVGVGVGAWLALTVATPANDIGAADGAAEAPPPEVRVAQAEPAEASGFAALVAAGDPAAGQTASLQCIGCHTFGEGEDARLGPNLFGVLGRAVASADGFTYSNAMAAVGAEGSTWTVDLLNAFLTSPQTAIPGTTMAFGGIEDDVTRSNLVAYLATLAPSADGAALPVEAAQAQRLVSYSTEQAERGQSRYERDCLECHGADLTGGLIGGPPLSGQAFMNRYANGTPASVMFGFMSTAMPPERPGRYSAEVYADLMAYILSQNGFAAGDPLPADIGELGNLLVDR